MGLTRCGGNHEIVKRRNEQLYIRCASLKFIVIVVRSALIQAAIIMRHVFRYQTATEINERQASEPRKFSNRNRKAHKLRHEQKVVEMPCASVAMQNVSERCMGYSRAEDPEASRLVLQNGNFSASGNAFKHLMANGWQPFLR